MRREKLLEIGRKGTDYDFVVPAGTQVENLEQGLAYFFIEVAKYRKISSKTFLAEVEHWVRQLEESQI